MTRSPHNQHRFQHEEHCQSSLQLDGSAELGLLTAGTTDLQWQMMLVKAHDENDNSHWMTSLRASVSAWKKLLRMAAEHATRGRGHHYWGLQTGTAVLESTSSWTIGEHVEDHRAWWTQDLKWKVSLLRCWDLVVGWCDCRWVGGGLFHGGWNVAHRREKTDIWHGDWDRVD